MVESNIFLSVGAWYESLFNFNKPKIVLPFFKMWYHLWLDFFLKNEISRLAMMKKFKNISPTWQNIVFNLPLQPFHRLFGIYNVYHTIVHWRNKFLVLYYGYHHLTDLILIYLTGAELKLNTGAMFLGNIV